MSQADPTADLGLTGRVVLVTGAGRGLGQAHARAQRLGEAGGDPHVALQRRVAVVPHQIEAEQSVGRGRSQDLLGVDQRDAPLARDPPQRGVLRGDAALRVAVVIDRSLVGLAGQLRAAQATVAVAEQLVGQREAGLQSQRPLEVADRLLEPLLGQCLLRPVEKLARTMNEVPGKLVRTVAAIRDAKEAA